MTDREWRLRMRIDQLLDDRDQLQNQIAHLQAQAADRNRLVKRIWVLTRSRDTWRLRALHR
jgi:hypothetical protein